MSQAPSQYADFGDPMPAPRRTSFLAVTSLVLSLICFIPAFPILAVIFGIAGLIRITSAKGRLGGTGLAVGGVVLGLIFSALQVGIVIGAMQMVSFMGKQFVEPIGTTMTAIESGDEAGSRALLVPASDQALTAADFGAFRDAYHASVGTFERMPQGWGEWWEAYSVVGQQIQAFQGQNDMIPMVGRFTNGWALVVIDFDEAAMNNQTGPNVKLPVENIIIVASDGTTIKLLEQLSIAGAPAARPEGSDPAMPGDPVIRVENVVKRFGGQTVLAGINLDIRPGETMVIMGGSGSGKSTMLRMMIGSFPPDEGRISMFGQDITHLEEEEMNQVRRKFGILFQSGALFNSMTLAENVALPLREHTDLDSDIIDIQVKIKLELVGLREAADKYPAQISGGMKKRAGLARALALDPKVLFYDEPSAGLDPVTSAQIDQLIVALSKQLGVTSIVVTHEMDSAFTIADRMAMLDKGRMLRVESREWFDRLRRTSEQDAGPLPQDERLIRQFLRGDALGPITDRKVSGSYEADLFGPAFAGGMPSIEPTRR